MGRVHRKGARAIRSSAACLAAGGGFTLVELMVAVVIVAVIAALSVLAFREVRATADAATATARLRGLAQANANYASDHAGRYVPVFKLDPADQPSVQWHFDPEFLGFLIADTTILGEAVDFDGVDGLPENVLDPVVVRAKQRFWSRISGSFGYVRENVPGGVSGGGRVLLQHSTMTVKEAAANCQFITCTDWVAKYSGRLLWRQNPVEGKTEDGKIAFRHRDKAIAVFYDGHTEMVTPADMESFDQRGGRDHVFWGGTRR